MTSHVRHSERGSVISDCLVLDAVTLCKLPADDGPCKDDYIRSYFNSAKGMCETFVYGGCDGNENNFESIEECQKTCSWTLFRWRWCPPFCWQPLCDWYCKFGFRHDEYGCELCSCIDPCRVNPPTNIVVAFSVASRHLGIKRNAIAGTHTFVIKESDRLNVLPKTSSLLKRCLILVVLNERLKMRSVIRKVVSSLPVVHHCIQI